MSFTVPENLSFSRTQHESADRISQSAKREANTNGATYQSVSQAVLALTMRESTRMCNKTVCGNILPPGLSRARVCPFCQPCATCAVSSAEARKAVSSRKDADYRPIHVPLWGVVWLRRLWAFTP